MKTTMTQIVTIIYSIAIFVFGIGECIGTPSNETVVVEDDFNIVSSPLTDNFLLFTAGPRNASVYQLSHDGTKLHRLGISGMKVPVAVDYDHIEQAVYWVDRENRSIGRYMLTTREQTTVVSLARPSYPEGVAVEPVARLIFYTDFGRDTVNVAKYDSMADLKTLVRNAGHPRAIHIDPVKYELYWTDWRNGRIEKCAYDGSNRIIILEIELTFLNGLALDLQARRMYWTDARFNRIQASTMDVGGGQVTILEHKSFIVFKNETYEEEQEAHYYGIAVDENYMYFTDWERSSVFRVSKNGSDLQTIGPPSLSGGQLSGIMIYESGRTIIGNAKGCADQNGNCSSMCLPSVSGRVCACPDSRRLNDDQLTCSVELHSNGPDLIWLEHNNLQTSYIYGLTGEPEDFLSATRFHAWTIKNPLWHFTAFDVDYHRSKLYLADRYDRLIAELQLNGSPSHSYKHYGTSSEVSGLAVDWVAGNIYWTDALFNWIVVASESDGSMKKVLINTGLESPHGIAVYPQKGMMYWTERGTEDKIECATLAGQDRKILTMDNVDDPHGITIDYTENRIYWVNRHSIYSMNLDGTDHKGLFASSRSNFVDIDAFRGHIFAVDLGTRKDQGAGVAPYGLWINKTDTRFFGRRKLTYPPTAVAMYHEDKQVITTIPCNKLECQHMCVSAFDNTAECICSDGFKLNTDNTTCTETANSAADQATFIYSIGDKLCAVPLKIAFGPTSFQEIDFNDFCFFKDAEKQSEYHALAFNFLSGDVYFSENNNAVKSIRRANMNHLNDNGVVAQGVGDIAGLALDNVASNLYWTDKGFGQIWVSRLDGSYQRLLLENLYNPHGIAVDNINKQLFWSEQGDDAHPPAIKVSNLDGSNNRTLFTDDLFISPAGITIDYAEERLYWIDTGARRLYSILLDGSSPRKESLATGSTNTEIIDVAVFRDYILYTERLGANSSGLAIVQKFTGTEPQGKTMVHKQHDAAFDVIAFYEHNQPLILGNIADSCGMDNGGCEQLCFPTIESHVCGCTSGLILSKDKKTCNSKKLFKDKFFLVADDYRRQIYQVSEDMSEVVALKFPSTDRPMAVDYDFVEERVYWSDFNASGVIKRMFLNGSNVETVRHGQNGSRVDGLAFEPTSRMLYYTDTGKNKISIMNPTGKFQKVLVYTELINPRAIVLVAKTGLMYFTTRGNRKSGSVYGTVEQCHMDGTNRVVIANDSLVWPSGLAIDENDDKLYWTDTITERIESSNLNGTMRQIVIDVDKAGDLFSIATHGQFIYWTDWNKRGLFKAKKDGSNIVQLFKNLFIGLNDIKYFSQEKYRKDPTACVESNGQCSHFCIPVPSQQRVCECPDNVAGLPQSTSNRRRRTSDDLPDDKSKAKVDGVNCNGVPSCPVDILNGHFNNRNCNFRIGSSCNYSCNTFYGKTFIGKVMCLPGGAWSKDTSALCTENICPILETPENAHVDGECPTPAGPGIRCIHICDHGYDILSGSNFRSCKADLEWDGVPLRCKVLDTCQSIATPENAGVNYAECSEKSQIVGTLCTHHCKEGYHRTGGDYNRRCTEYLTWSGHDLQCGEGFDNTNTTLGPVVVAPSTQRKSLIPLIVGIIVAIALILAIVIAILLFMIRRRNILKGGAPVVGRYIENENAAIDNVAIPKSITYNAQFDTVNIAAGAGSVAFENPGYATHEEMEAMKAEARAISAATEEDAGPLPQKEPYMEAAAIQAIEDQEAKALPYKEPLGTDAVTVEVKVHDESTHERTAFSNPLFAQLDKETSEALDNNNLPKLSSDDGQVTTSLDDVTLTDNEKVTLEAEI